MPARTRRCGEQATIMTPHQWRGAPHSDRASRPRIDSSRKRCSVFVAPRRSCVPAAPFASSRLQLQRRRLRLAASPASCSGSLPARAHWLLARSRPRCARSFCASIAGCGCGASWRRRCRAAAPLLTPGAGRLPAEHRRGWQACAGLLGDRHALGAALQNSARGSVTRRDPRSQRSSTARSSPSAWPTR